MKNNKQAIFCLIAALTVPSAIAIAASQEKEPLLLKNASYRLPSPKLVDRKFDPKRLFVQVKKGRKPLVFKYGNTKLIVHLNLPIQNAKTECIVNAANGGIFGADGVAKFIQDKVDKKKWKDYVATVHNALDHFRALDYAPLFPSGSALRMPSYYPDASPIKQIIHAVGPRASENVVPHKLYRAYLNTLELANQQGIASITFPLLSAGIFGVSDPDFNGRLNPIKPAIAAVNDFIAHNPNSSLKEIHFTLFPVKGGPDWYSLFVEALNNLPAGLG